MKLGPALPKQLEFHSMVELGGSLYIISGVDTGFGFSDGSRYQKEILKLTCAFGTCSWTTLTQQIKVGRYGAVLIPVMDSFCTPIWFDKFGSFDVDIVSTIHNKWLLKKSTL